MFKGHQPKEQETPAKETQLFQDCANSLDEDDATGDKIKQELADIALKRWGKKLSSDKIKSFSDIYKQPQNCSDIKGIEVNPRGEKKPFPESFAFFDFDNMAPFHESPWEFRVLSTPNCWSDLR